jgi:hypothetical protein
MAQREVAAPSEEPASWPLVAEISAQRIQGEPELAISYCPRCSARLAARSCKMICESCGYYMSCSDFY